MSWQCWVCVFVCVCVCVCHPSLTRFQLASQVLLPIA